jgi:diadenosine tetraphosphate (Ap4A) HIT family hydrolase
MSKKHAVELYDLSDKDAFSFLKDVMIASRALKEITAAAKINYEIHGNTIPHLHVHLSPRYLVGDRFGESVIDSRNVSPPVYSGNEFHEFIKEMRERISNALV